LADPTVLVDLPLDVAAALFSRGLDPAGILANVEVSGHGELPEQVKQGLVAFFPRT
jgi:hypothetical protein